MGQGTFPVTAGPVLCSSGPGLFTVQSAERATNVEKQHPNIHCELGMKTTGPAVLATALAAEGGLGSVPRHTDDSSYASNTILCINRCSVSALWPCFYTGKLYERTVQKKKLKTVKGRKI